MSTGDQVIWLDEEFCSLTPAIVNNIRGDRATISWENPTRCRNVNTIDLLEYS